MGNHFANDIRTFDRELTKIFTLLDDAVFDVEQAEVIHGVYVEQMKLLLAAYQAIDAKARALGGAAGSRITPVKIGANGGYYRQFEKGAIYWHPQVGAFWVYGAIYQKYLKLGAEAGFLGYPTTDETGLADGVGRFNHFQGGSIFWTAGTGAWEIHGAIRARWQAMGWQKSALGYPTTDETGTPDGVGRYNHFQGGSIYWTPDTGAHEVLGHIRDEWKSLGWEKGFLGYPTLDERDWVEPGSIVLGRITRFQRGAIGLHTKSTNPVVLPDAQVYQSGLHPSGIPITGWVELMINSAGFFAFKGHLHDSGWTGYSVVVACGIDFIAPDGATIVATEEGHVEGTATAWTAGSGRDHDWFRAGFEPRIRQHWDVLHTRNMITRMNVDVEVGDVVASVLAAIPIGTAVGIAAYVTHLFADKKAKVCPGHPTIYRDPIDGTERTGYAWPICRNDPNVPNDDCCKHP